MRKNNGSHLRPVRWPMWILLLTLLLTVSGTTTSTAAVSSLLSEESIQGTLDHIQGALQRQQDAVINLEGFSRDMRELETGVQRLEALQIQLQVQQAQVVQQANARIVQRLLEQLQEIYDKETRLRRLLKDSAAPPNAVVVEDNDDEDSDIQQKQQKLQEAVQDSIVTVAMLQERLDITAIVRNSETQLHEWIIHLIKEELQNYKNNILESLPSINTFVGQTGTNDAATTAGAAAVCPTAAEIIQRVQQALTIYANDGIGKVDHLQLPPGSKVVHSLTSETYVPPPAVRQTLGSTWWRTYIPEDWERLLPEGWQDWNVAVPSYLSHSMTFFGGHSDVAPPEAVLQKNTLPGSCWPMAGQNGQVTLKLPYPVVVEQISIDHASVDILPNGSENSAPKVVKVIGYPPCNENSGDDCRSMGFERNDPIEIAQFAYNIEEGSKVQTFDSHYGQAMKELTATTTDQGASMPVKGEDHLSSCSSATVASCTVPPKQSVAGVTFKVFENWGNPEFTCLYRVRIHGEPEYIET